jgi:hypothetical protein
VVRRGRHRCGRRIRPDARRHRLGLPEFGRDEEDSHLEGVRAVQCARGGYYFQAINKDGPHPAAARLCQEFLFSDEGQNLFLKGLARPVRADSMTRAGTVDKNLLGALPSVEGAPVVPTKSRARRSRSASGATGPRPSADDGAGYRERRAWSSSSAGLGDPDVLADQLRLDRGDVPQLPVAGSCGWTPQPSHRALAGDSAARHVPGHRVRDAVPSGGPPSDDQVADRLWQQRVARESAGVCVPQTRQQRNCPARGIGGPRQWGSTFVFQPRRSLPLTDGVRPRPS